MGYTPRIRLLPLDDQMIRDLLIRSVHHYDNDAPVFVHETRGLAPYPVCRYRDAMCARPDEFGKMTDIVERIRVDQLSVARIAMHRCKTEIAGVVGSAV